MTRDVSGHGMFVFAEHGPRRGELVTVQLEGQSALECVVRHVVPGVGVGIELLTREGREFAAFHELVARAGTIGGSFDPVFGFGVALGLGVVVLIGSHVLTMRFAREALEEGRVGFHE